MTLRQLAVMTATGLLLFKTGYPFDEDVVLKPSGYFGMETGQIVKGGSKWSDAGLKNIWMRNIYGQFGIQATLSPLDQVDLSVGIKTYNEFPSREEVSSTRRLYYYVYLHQAEYCHLFINTDQSMLRMGIGYFPFKYNDDAKNLGEYLFRSGTYPQYLIGEFDFPQARLAGINLSGRLGEALNVNCILFSNTEWAGVNDWSLAVIGSYKFGQFMELGAGGTLNSFLPSNKGLTTPTGGNAPWYQEGGYKYPYTFKGEKVIGRFSFDPKVFFPGDLFGEKDLKVYGEAAILGVKNYPRAMDKDSMLDYSNIAERIPVMAGFNLPAFKILDVLSLEAEWFGNRYPNNMERIVKESLPIPYPTGWTESDLEPYKKNHFKWSLYGTRTIARHYQFTFQAADDHFRGFALNETTQDWEEVCRAPDHWYYLIKFGVAF